MKQSLKKIAAATFALSIVFTSSPVLDVLPANASTASHQILSELTELNDDTAPGIEMNENGVARSIDGQLSDTQVENDEDAKEVLRNISELLGVKDTEQELKFKGSSNSSYNTVYTFKQYYKDLELTNSYITIIVNNSTGRSDFLNSSFIPDFSMDVNPDVSASNAAQIVMEKYSVTLSEAPRLVIYSADNTVHHLAWEVKTDSFSPSMVYLDAKNGEILYAEMPSSANDEGDLAATYSLEKDSPLSGPFTVDIARDKDEENLYKLHDTERNIYVLDSSNFYCEYKGCSLHTKSKDYNDLTNKSLVIKKEDNNWDGYETELAVLYSVQKAYDFYDELMWTGTDDKNSDLFIVPQLRYVDGEGVNNAFSMVDSNTLLFGAGDDLNTTNFGFCYDTVVHEYTHRVTEQKIGWNGTLGESNSLDEAYSDIMGEYAEETPDWRHGTYYINEAICSRDLSNPTSDPVQYDRYTGAEHFKNVEEHDGSTVISHAAYLMHKLGIPDHVGKKLWYISLDYLPQGNNATFADCRAAINKAADKVFDIYSYSKRLEWAYIIRKAFNTVNITDKYDLVGDVNLDFKIDEDDITDLKDYLAPDKTFQFTQPVQEHYCDLNADGVIDDADVAYLENVIYGKITITEQPKNLTQSIHSVIRLSVTAQGEDLRYEWYSSNDDHTGFNIEVYDKERLINCHIQRPTLICPMTYDRIGQEIYCVITDKYNHKVKTETITLQATNPLNVTREPAAELTAKNYGDIVTVFTGAEGVDLTYEWLIQYPGTSEKVSTGVLSNMYQLQVTKENEGSKIWCLISDKFENKCEVGPSIVTVNKGSATDTEQSSTIDIASQPINASAEIGAKVQTSVQVTGDEVSYQWYCRESGQQDFEKTEITENTFQTMMTAKLHGSEVFCIITDEYGNEIITQTATFSATASQNSTPSVSGDVNGDGILDISDAIFLARFVAEDSTLDMSNFNVQNADINGDGLTTAADTVYLIKKIAKLV